MGEHIDIHHCLPNRMHFFFVSRSSPEASTLPPSFAKIPALGQGGGRDHVKEVKEIMYLLRPEMRPKIKAKIEVSDDLNSNLYGLLLGRTPVKVSRSSGTSPASKNREPELDDEGICFFAQEIWKKSKCQTLVEAFKVLDTNGSGGLSLSEFELGLRAMDIVMDKDESRRIFRWLDMDKQGLITLSEWNRLDVIIKMLQRSGRYRHKDEESLPDLPEGEEQASEGEEEEEEEVEGEPDMKMILGQRRAAIVQGLDLGFTKKIIQWKSDVQAEVW